MSLLLERLLNEGLMGRPDSLLQWGVLEQLGLSLAVGLLARSMLLMVWSLEDWRLVVGGSLETWGLLRAGSL